MTDIHPVLTLFGETFSPRRAIELTGVEFSRICEPGEFGTERGKFLGKRYPHGSAHLRPPETISPDDRIEWLIAATASHLSTFREVGATICKFHLAVLYWDQCNLCFPNEQLTRIASLGVTFTISCYRKTSREKPAHLRDPDGGLADYSG